MPAGVRLEIDKSFIRHLETVLETRLKAAGEYLRGRVVKAISDPTRTLGPSMPGNNPHADTGKLRQSIFSDVTKNGSTVVVGSPLTYSLWLEYGTSQMEARPFLRPAFRDAKQGMIRMVTKPFPQQ